MDQVQPQIQAARHKPSSCVGCQCFNHGTDFSAIEGTGANGIMFVGEASGEFEAREQLPFRPAAPAGSVLERILRRMGLDRQSFSITNIVRCRPRLNWLEESPWEFQAINHCRTNLENAIAERKPRVIVALGGVAERELTGFVGKQLGISHLAGYVLPLASGKYETVDERGRAIPIADIRRIPIIGDFHPAYLRRGKASHQGYFSRVLQRAINISKGTDRNWMWDIEPNDESSWRRYFNWHLHPGVDDVVDFYNYCRNNQNLWIAVDFETAESQDLDEDARVGFQDTQIIQAQFAVMRGGSPWCIAMPYEDPFNAFIIALLHLPNPKFGHNFWVFDHRVAQASAAREGWIYAPPSRVHDTLQMFHHWQPDLPAHLQFASSFINFPFPWKHLATANLPFYGCADVHSDLLLGIMLESTLKRDRLWGDDTIGYLGQVYYVRSILDDMQDRGVPIDDEARRQLDAEFDVAQGALLAEIQGLAPKECCRVSPKTGYKGVPPQVKPYLLDGGPTFTFIEECEDPERYRYEQREFSVADVDAASGAPVLRPTMRWCRVYDFNPNSQLQVISYMKAKRHKIPKSQEEDDEGNRKDTTAEKPMRRLASQTGDHFYLKVIEYRGFSKLRGTYIDGFKPGKEDGFVHPTFGFDTAIGQLTSKNPNSQNFPKLKPTPALAKSLRGMVRATSGKIITEWDYKGFHALTLGFLAEDPVWIRLARLDIHSFVAGHVLGLWNGPSILKESDEDLMRRFMWLKSDPERKRVRDDQAKHGILGIGNGLSAKGLYERYMENFPPKRCTACCGSGREAGARLGTFRKCGQCKGTGSIPGLRVAQTFLSALQVLAPRIFAYQRQERKAAHNAGDQGYFTPFAFARRFYEVYVFNKRYDPVHDAEPPHGDQAEQAVSYRHTNIAHCHLREVMKELDRAGHNRKYGLFNQVHDALYFHFDRPMLEEHVRDILPVMAAPSKILRNAIAPKGLTVDVEMSWGECWRDMESYDLKAVYANLAPVA